MHDPKNIKCPSVYGTFSAELCTCPEQKKDWEEEFDKEFVKYATGSGEHFNWGTKPPHIKDFLRTQISLAEERGRREAKAQFDAMLAEDIEKIESYYLPNHEAYEESLNATRILEARRLFLKK